jgi:hypothetical protein
MSTVKRKGECKHRSLQSANTDWPEELSDARSDFISTVASAR